MLKTKKSTSEVKSWYRDKCFSLSVQRNILLIVCLILFVSVVGALVVIKTIVEKKSVEPYVIKISKHEQIPVSVNIESIKKYASTNQLVLEYFLLNYIRVRESYNHETYKFDYNTFVRSMSTPAVFRVFWNQVNDTLTGVISNMGQKGRVETNFKQIAFESRNNVAIIRISKNLIIEGNLKSVSHQSIKIHYIFDTASMNYRDVFLNPLGIKIDFYEVTDEKVL
jgi:type IV secretory pathway component VirB8